MKQTRSRKRRVWFWVGVGLLTASALWWLLLVLTPGDPIITGAITTIIPIALGIFCVLRSRKLQVTKGTASESTADTIVIKMPGWLRGIGWFLVLVGGFLVLMSLASLWSDVIAGFFVMAGLGLIPILFGISILSMSLKVSLNQPPGYITVTRWKIPIFLWFLRTNRIPLTQLCSVRFTSVELPTMDLTEITATRYQLKVLMNSGEVMTLWDSRYKRDEVERLASRIQEFV
jgi:hypothetical protein